MSNTLIDGRRPFVLIDRAVLFDLALTPVEFTVYAVIVAHANNETQVAFPSQGRIAEIAGVSRKTVNETVRKLVDQGLLTTRVRDGFKTALQYTICDLSTMSRRVTSDVTQGYNGCHTGLHELDSTNKTQRTIAGAPADAEPVQAGPPAKARKERPRNPWFDALTDVLGLNGVSIPKSRAATLAKAAHELKAAGGYEPDDVRLIAAWFRSTFGQGVTLTERAIVKYAPDWHVARNKGRAPSGSTLVEAKPERKRTNG